MTEIMRPNPRYDSSVLGLLPDKTLPEVEESLAENFAGNDTAEANLASLLLRYADGSVLPVVLPKIEEKVGTWACDPQDKSLAFALKVDPETAKPLIERALTARGPESNACRHGALTDVAQLQPTPSLEDIALPALDDPDPEVAANAAGYLGEYGSAAAEEPLWEHYESWSRQWGGRADELRGLPGTDSPDSWEENRGESLARALADGIGWLADGNMLRRIAALDVTSNLKFELESNAKAWEQHPLSIVVMDSHPPCFQLAQYSLRSLEELKTKLGQFPRGSTFTWSSDESPEEQAAFKEISAFAQELGVTVRVAKRN